MGDKGLLAAAALIAAALAAGPVFANTTVIIPGGPFSLANPYGGLPNIALYKTQTYDFTFTLTEPLDHGGWAIEAQAATQHAQEVLSFDLYSGSPGSGVYWTSSSTSLAATVLFSPTLGDYYIEIKPAAIAVNGEVLSGTLVKILGPEPATWSMIMVGFAALGLALRRRAGRSPVHVART